MDALILSIIPQEIWEECESAVIEVTALEQINEQDVKNLVSMFEGFEFVSWSSSAEQEGIELREVSDFWSKKSGSFRNLFLSKEV